MRTHRHLRFLLAGFVLLTALRQTNSTAIANSSSEDILKSGKDPKKPPKLNTTVYLPYMPRMDQSETGVPDMVNPSRGYYRWRGQEIVPNGDQALDAYDRYSWSEIEKSKGVYDFSKIDEDIAQAEARGQKFAFRIRAMKDTGSGGIFVPSYLKNCGWYNKNTFIPDWNAACFLDNAENMLLALGQRYDHDPRIAWIDIGIYGTWGEWALSDKIYSKAPAGIEPATRESLFRIVDMHLNAFPTARKVMMAKTNEYAVAHALTASNQVGWRVDCLGKPGYFDFDTNPNYDVSWPYMQNRWQTAPVIVEFCSAKTNGMDLTYQTAEEQVVQWHVSLVGNGNINSWEGLNKKQKNNLQALGKKAGYRYQVNNVSLPGSLAPGQAFEIRAQWQNTGVAPHYEQVEVKYLLYNADIGGIAWEAPSGIDLRAVLPGAAQAQADTLQLPDSLPSGHYQLRVQVVDPAGLRRPLKLDMPGLQPDGSYYLKTITIQ